MSRSMSRTQNWLRSNNKFDLNDGGKGQHTATISITSGKGGVGKTTLAIKLGKLLSIEGNKVLVIDCDFNLSNTLIKLNLPLNNNLYSLIKNKKSFKDCIHKDGRFHLLSACNGNIDLLDSNISLESIILDIIHDFGSDYNYIILDSPAGIGRSNLILNAYTDYRFVVVTPDKSSITDSYSLMKILKNKYGINNFHLIMNKIENKNQYRKIVKSLSETVDQFLSSRLKILGGIQKFNLVSDRFDEIMAKNDYNEYNKTFFKVLKRFSEQRDENCLYKSCGLLGDREQDVHRTIK